MIQNFPLQPSWWRLLPSPPSKPVLPSSHSLPQHTNATSEQKIYHRSAMRSEEFRCHRPPLPSPLNHKPEGGHNILALSAQRRVIWVRTHFHCRARSTVPNRHHTKLSRTEKCSFSRWEGLTMEREGGGGCWWWLILKCDVRQLLEAERINFERLWTGN